MSTKNQKITLKSLKEDIVTLKEQLNENNIRISTLEKELQNANSEINKLKGIEVSQENALVVKCDSCDFSSESRKTLRKHILQNHHRKSKCKFCDAMFEKNSDLESHLDLNHDSVERFQCDHCDKKFVLEWRLRKHKRMHKQQNTINCHYFNNKKDCPFEKIGCMFRHAYSKMCKYGNNCDKVMCSFQHNNDEKVTGKRKWNCDECEFTAIAEKDLADHLDDVHEYWNWNDSFCDNFCRGDLGMHICMSYMDFEEYIGFDVKNTFSTEETDYNYQCLKCHKTDEAKNNMQSHIKEKHKLNKVTKCNLCMYEATSFTGLKKHFRSKHVKS